MKMTQLLNFSRRFSGNLSLPSLFMYFVLFQVLIEYKNIKKTEGMLNIWFYGDGSLIYSGVPQFWILSYPTLTITWR